MDDILKAAGVTDCYVCGIATDVCVGEDSRISSRRIKPNQHSTINAKLATVV